jgi:exosortase
MTLSRRNAFFGLFSLVLVVIAFDPIRRFVSLSSNDTSSYVVLIPFISVMLIYFDRERIFRNPVSSVLPASIAFVAAGLLFYASRMYGQGLAEQDGIALMTSVLIALWLGGFLLIYGSAAFKAALFPLLFLGFAIPIPSRLLDAATVFLQKASADMASVLFMATRTPVYRDNFIFTLSGLTIEVAKECSSIRSSIGMLIVILLAAHLYLRSTWTKVILVLAVVPISALKNAVRIVTLTLLALHVDMGFITGRLHHQGGIVFMIFGLALMYPLLLFLAKSEKQTTNFVSGVRS